MVSKWSCGVYWQKCSLCSVYHRQCKMYSNQEDVLLHTLCSTRHATVQNVLVCVTVLVISCVGRANSTVSVWRMILGHDIVTCQHCLNYSSVKYSPIWKSYSNIMESFSSYPNFCDTSFVLSIIGVECQSSNHIQSVLK